MSTDLTGIKIGKLFIIKRGSSDGKTRKYKVKCDCGRILWTTDASLRRKATVKSCGCYTKERMTKHGSSKSKLYQKWQNMKKRCYYKNAINYHNYGGRGIKVFKNWIESYPVFEKYIIRNLGLPKPKEQLDRIDNNGDYEPGNLKWSTNKQNANNRRTHNLYLFKGENLTASQIFDIIKPNMLFERFRSRLRAGLKINQIIKKPRFYFHPQNVRERRKQRACLTRGRIGAIKVR